MRLKKIIAALLSVFTLFWTVSNFHGIDEIQNNTMTISAKALEIQDVWFNQISPEFNGGEPIKGVDISSIVSLENAGIKFYNERGEEQDIFKTLSANGVNYIRVRIWNEPYTENGESYGGGNNDLKTAAEIGRRAAKYHMKLLADIQYSDFWADPEKQTRPKYWQQHDHETLKGEIYKYTTWVLETLTQAGAEVGMVQVGNETNCFFCGETDMYKICDLFASGDKAVRDFDKSILIAHHFANPTTGYYDWYAKVMNECKLDYDIFATSYYPYWHGTTENLTSVLKSIANTYDKYVMVAETAYPYTNEDGDTFGNAVNASSSDAVLRYDISVQGQAQCLTDVFQAVADVGEKGIGVFYWEPAWIGKSGLSWEEQCELWKKYGSGWATEYAAEYDESVTGAGGSSYDNQGLFDFDGKPLESLQVFSHIFPQKESPQVPPEYMDGNYITSLTVFDTENAKNWSVHTNLQKGDKVFGDREFAFTHVPDFMTGAEWISTSCNSKLFTEKQAEFIVGKDATVYVGLDARIQTPEWLNGWTNTNETLTDNGNPPVTYQVYRKNVKENETVMLGAVNMSDAVNYIVAAGEMQPERVLGDVNADGQFTIADVVMLQKWLICAGDLTDWQIGDLCKDKKIDILDLCFMKYELVKNRS